MIERQSIVHDVTYPHPPERVWQALVDSDELAVWLMPNDFVPVVGHQFTVNCGSHGLVQGEVLELDPPRRLRCRWVGSFGHTVVTFQLTPTEAGTRLHLEHSGWSTATTADQEDFNGGWGKMLTELAGLLAGKATADQQTNRGLRGASG